MISVHDRLISSHKKLSSKDVWTHLSTLYDLQALNESEIVPFPNKNGEFGLRESDLVDLCEKSFPRTSYINTPAETAKTETSQTKSSSKSGKQDSKSSSHSSKSDSKSDSKSSSSSSKHDSKSGSSSSRGEHKSSHSSSSKSSHHSSGSNTPGPSPKRTKRTRNTPSSNSSPATPTEPPQKRRR
ncbi:suppressor protein SRP40 isoform X2 [Aplysia californica]|nr:suppressor protein SRP40 isoform X2 [Aplysia californica]